MRQSSFSAGSLFIFISLLTVSQSFLCTEEMYEDYLRHWGRNFTEEKKTSEYSAKFNSYCENRRYVDDINSQKLSYDLDIYWQWMDKSETERKQIVRLELPMESIASSAVPREQVSGLRKVSSVLPLYVDYRISGDVSSIKAQGDKCGCCWAFSSVGLYQSWMMLKGEAEYDLSEEYILECTTKYTKNVRKIDTQSTCKGGFPEYGGGLAKLNGIPLEERFPYIAINYSGSTYPDTPGICDANQTIMYARDPNVTTFAVSKNITSAQMRQYLAYYGPVGAVLYADTGFLAYKSGIYSGCPRSFASSYNSINHAVVIVGYDIYGNYIVKNSWGTTWGQNGFGVVSKDADCALTALALQYLSTAAPGSGVLFYNQTNLNNSDYQMLTSFALLVIMLMLMN